ncbi:MAG: DUF7488 domain-containing protein [Wolinella sp.]
MKKIIVTCLLLSVSVFGYDFSRCGERIALSSEKVGNSYGLAINEKHLIHYSKTPPVGYKIIKSDPFVGLYLLEAKSQKVPLELRELDKDALEDTLGVGISGKKGISEGNVTKRMTGVLSYARFSQKTPPNSIISSICYQVYGLGVGGNEFIESSYLKRFLEQKSVQYGELGIRFEKGEKKPIVALLNPFSATPFRVGDQIFSINNTVISSLEELEHKVYELTPGKIVKVSVLRSGEMVSFDADIYPRTGGMLTERDDFLERIGIRFSADWRLLGAQKMLGGGLELLRDGDQLLRVNGIEMPHGEEAGLRLLSRFAGEEMSWLIRRDDFEFFIKVNKNIVSTAQ